MLMVLEPKKCKVNQIDINYRITGEGPPLLMLHGHPQTHVMWHKVAPTLAQHFTIITPDLRGYSDSDKPISPSSHSLYSKRIMAQDMYLLMAELGFKKFFVLAHDRGARSAGMTPFTPEALAEYSRCLSLPNAAYGICEDYRASAGIDLEHDEEDIRNQHHLTCPTLVMWGKNGAIEQCFKPLEEWKKVATQVQGQALPSGHYIAEEVPELLIEKTLTFFSSTK